MHPLSETDTFNTTVTVIDDGDIIIPTSASIVVANQSLANRTRWLFNRTGPGFLVAFDSNNVSDTGAPTNGPTVIHTWNASAYGAYVSVLGPMLTKFGGAQYAPVGGDIIRATITGSLLIQNDGTTAETVFAKLKAAVSFDGGSTWLDNLGAEINVTGQLYTTGDVHIVPFCMTIFFQRLVSATSVNIGLNAKVLQAAHSETIALAGSYMVEANAVRAT